MLYITSQLSHYFSQVLKANYGYLPISFFFLIRRYIYSHPSHQSFFFFFIYIQKTYAFYFFLLAPHPTLPPTPTPTPTPTPPHNPTWAYWQSVNIVKRKHVSNLNRNYFKLLFEMCNIKSYLILLLLHFLLVWVFRRGTLWALVISLIFTIFFLFMPSSLPGLRTHDKIRKSYLLLEIWT